MFTYVIAIFIAIAALARRVLRHMYGFSSFTEDEKNSVEKTLDISEDSSRLSNYTLSNSRLSYSKISPFSAFLIIGILWFSWYCILYQSIPFLDIKLSSIPILSKRNSAIVNTLLLLPIILSSSFLAIRLKPLNHIIFFILWSCPIGFFIFSLLSNGQKLIHFPVFSSAHFLSILLWLVAYSIALPFWYMLFYFFNKASRQ